ncbi:hypothetical protein ACFTAO_08175 [Paenibacillus rhizoplanae]
MIYDNVLQLIGNTPIVKLNYLPQPLGGRRYSLSWRDLIPEAA